MDGPPVFSSLWRTLNLPPIWLGSKVCKREHDCYSSGSFLLFGVHIKKDGSQKKWGEVGPSIALALAVQFFTMSSDIMNWAPFSVCDPGSRSVFVIRKSNGLDEDFQAMTQIFGCDRGVHSATQELWVEGKCRCKQPLLFLNLGAVLCWTGSLV